MLPNRDDTFYHLATVPGQHMWGLETSVIMALFARVCIADSQPFYPRDIVEQLASLPQPRALISTPVHLRALTSLRGALPPLANVLCATAPLDPLLAEQIEDRFQTRLREVYGCSEVGSMSIRQPARTDIWQGFDGLDFEFSADGSTRVGAPHLPETTVLEDRLENLGDNRFRLQGRQSDQIKIAGKRGSLMQINQVLLASGAVRDGVIFLPPQQQSVPRLAALVVLDNKHSLDAVKNHLRAHLDDAFLPRPMYQVDHLPREENGKLGQQRLLKFYQQTKTLQA
jgi:acyl-coenzyme A synthetase/AMP-(fatty) acid ligase